MQKFRKVREAPRVLKQNFGMEVSKREAEFYWRMDQRKSLGLMFVLVG